MGTTLKVCRYLIPGLAGIFLIFGCAKTAHAQRAQERKVVELVREDQSVDVVDSRGRSLLGSRAASDKGASVGIRLNMAMEPQSSTGFHIPSTVEDAGQELKELMPSSFYGVIVNKFHERYCYGYFSSDQSAESRYIDFLSFLTKAWQLDEPSSELVSKINIDPLLNAEHESKYAVAESLIAAQWEREHGRSITDLQNCPRLEAWRTSMVSFCADYAARRRIGSEADRICKGAADH